MRQRSTFVHDAGQEFRPSELLVTESQLLHGGLNAAREERLTYSLTELPEELQEVLNGVHELHVRWTPEHNLNTATPFLARISPGLHVFYTALAGHSDDLVCPVLSRAFSSNLKCQSPNAIFTTPLVLSERFASSSALQYYSSLPSLKPFVAYLQRNFCPRSDVRCIHSVSLLNVANYLDIDYDSISHALTLSAFWSRPPSVFFDPTDETTVYDRWKIDARRTSQNDRVEVGILSSTQASDPHDVQLSGFLTVLGEDDEPKPTLFHFPARHHVLPTSQAVKQQYKVSVEQPQGLHPTMQISFPSAKDLLPPTSRPQASHCSLQSYLVLPSYLFIDEYAFRSNDPLFAEGHHIVATHAISGELDLEAPNYFIEKWGSTALLELALPMVDSPTVDSPWNVTVPLHLRYLAPVSGGQQSVDLPWPIVYWACTAEEGTKFPVNPFDRVNLGFDGLYGPRTMFYHLRPHGSAGTRLVEKLSVPVYNNDRLGAQVIELGTLVVVLTGFFWITARLWPGIKTELGFSRTSARAEEKKSQ